MQDGIGTEIKLGSLVVHASSSKYAGTSSIGIITSMTDRTASKNGTALRPDTLIVVDAILKERGIYDEKYKLLKAKYAVDEEVKKPVRKVKWSLRGFTSGYNKDIHSVAVVPCGEGRLGDMAEAWEEFYLENNFSCRGNQYQGEPAHGVIVKKGGNLGVDRNKINFNRYGSGAYAFANTKCPVPKELVGKIVNLLDLPDCVAKDLAKVYNRQSI